VELLGLLLDQGLGLLAPALDLGLALGQLALEVVERALLLLKALVLLLQAVLALVQPALLLAQLAADLLHLAVEGLALLEEVVRGLQLGLLEEGVGGLAAGAEDVLGLGAHALQLGSVPQADDQKPEQEATQAAEDGV